MITRMGGNGMIRRDGRERGREGREGGDEDR